MDRYDEDHNSVPQLLSLLARSLQEATRGHDTHFEKSYGIPPDDHDPPEQDLKENQQVGVGLGPNRVRRPAGCHPSSRIVRLQRVFNILLFGSPSYAEAIEKAEAEDNGFGAVNTKFDFLGDAITGFSYDTSTGSGEAVQSSEERDELSRVLAEMSTASLQLRRSRRFDPANAFDGLVDGLIARHGQDNGDLLNMFRVLTALRDTAGTPQDVDDWEVVGSYGRQVLETLYSKKSRRSHRNPTAAANESTGVEDSNLPHTGSMNTNVPVAMFFHHGQRGDGRHRRAGTSDLYSPVSTNDASDEGPDAETGLSLIRAAESERFLLPNDCALHSDSTTPGVRGGETCAGFGIERMPWFTNAEFMSERALPNVTRIDSLDRCMTAVVRSPLSPTAWTRSVRSAHAGGKKAPSSGTYKAGGPPAAQLGSTDHGAEISKSSICDKSSFSRGVDLCGAIHHRAGVEVRSPAVKELRMALSFPDLDDAPTDLLEAAQFGKRASTINVRDTVANAGGSTGNPQKSYRPRSPYATQFEKGALTPACREHRDESIVPSQQRMRASPRKRSLSAWDRTFAFNKNSDRIEDSDDQDAVASLLDPVGWQRAESGWKDPAMPRLVLAPAALLTGEGGKYLTAFEVCYREHFAGVGGDTQPPAITEVELMHRVLAVMQGVPSESFQYDRHLGRMWVSGCQDDTGNMEGHGKASLLPPRASRPSSRVAGLSADAIESFLNEYALAGTWYRRVEEFAACLVDTSAAAGQVAQAFGVELRRQLSRIQAAILAVAIDVAAAGGARDSAEDDGLGRGGKARAPVDCSADRCCSLAGVLHCTTEVRRAVAGLADLCGLAHDDLGPGIDSVRIVAERFPRGASLLTHLYRAAEVRAASEPRSDEPTSGSERVMGSKDSALALLVSAAMPYLSMLSRWLWSAEMQQADDPYGEFPILCRERPVKRSSTGGIDWDVEAPWVRDGGGSFMTEAFRENIAASTPCFLEGGILAAAIRTGKILRLLKLSSPEFFESCAASPPPPLSLVPDAAALKAREATFARLSLLRKASGFSAAREVRVRVAEEELRKGGDGGGNAFKSEKSALRLLELQRERDRALVHEARRRWVEGLNKDRAAAASMAANWPASPRADLSEEDRADPSTAAGSQQGKGMLSFLDPPTSEAEEQAAAVLRERYRILGEEVDVRAARARWVRRRNKRARAARLALKVLYSAEARMWANELANIKAARATVSVAEPEEGSSNNIGDGSAVVEAVTIAVEDGTNVEKVEFLALDCLSVRDDGEVDEAGTLAVGVRGELDRDAGVGVPISRGEGTIDRDESIEVDPMKEDAMASVPADPSSAARDASNEVGASAAPRTHGKSLQADSVYNEQGKKHLSELSRWSSHGEETGGRHDEHEVKFSHVRIVQEPGGSSAGAAIALGGGTDEGCATLERANAIGTHGRGGDDGRGAPFRFSHVSIMQEPGGKSSGVSQALGVAKVDDSGDEEDSPVASTIPESAFQGSPDAGGMAGGDSCVVTAGVDPNRNGDDKDEHKRAIDRQTGSSTDSIKPMFAPVQDVDAAARESGDAVRPTAPSFAVPPNDLSNESRAAALSTRKPQGLGPAGNVPCMHDIFPESEKIDADARRNGNKARAVPSGAGTLLTAVENQKSRQRLGDTSRAGDNDITSSLPLEVLVRRCIREPVLAQCRVVDSAALEFLVRGAGAVEHLASLRMFLLGLNSGFLLDFTLRLLEGLYDGGVDWRRASNLDAAFAASAAATGLESVPLFDNFKYEIDFTCGGVLGGGALAPSGDRRGGESAAYKMHEQADGIIQIDRVGELEQHDIHDTGDHSDHVSYAHERYSPTALSFVSPVLEVAWPLGVLLPTGALLTYGSIHRALFRHHLALHRLRRLRLTLRDLDLVVEASTIRGVSMGGGGGDGGGSRPQAAVARKSLSSSSWDRGRMHWVHLFRHEMQHMADSLQSFFSEQAEAGWPDLRNALVSSSPTRMALPTAPAVGGLAVLSAAHARYISDMRRNMFLGSDRSGVVARAKIDELYEVVCTVGRVTDDLAAAAATVRVLDGDSFQSFDFGRNPSGRSQARGVAGKGDDDRLHSSRRNRHDDAVRNSELDGVGRYGRNGDGQGDVETTFPSMVFPDKDFAELVSARERFDAARKGLCGALAQTAAAGGGRHARPLLAILDYRGYGSV